MAVYSDYAKDRIGWFFGLTGWQLGTLAVTSLPVFWAINTHHWPLVGTLGAAWAFLPVLVVPSGGGPSADVLRWFLIGGIILFGTTGGLLGLILARET